MKAYYRLSDNGYNKLKPDYINNQNCFSNFFVSWGINYARDVTVFLDCVTQENYLKLITFMNEKWGKLSPNFERTNAGSSAAGFVMCLNEALKLPDEEIVYFVEGDYVHKPNIQESLLDGFSTGAHFVTLYSHKDKWIPASKGGNPLIGEDGAEITKVYLGSKYAWMLTNSTTCTWASKVKTLKETETILRKHTSGTYPHDMEMFLELRKNGYGLIQPVPPSLSTHGELKWLAPLLKTESDEISWGKIIFGTA
jgi:hypothetical protein